MRELYDMFRGALAPEKVLAAAGEALEPSFYAHLYVGLYYEAFGRAADALSQIRMAAADRYAEAGGYMHLVARVHLARLERAGRL